MVKTVGKINNRSARVVLPSPPNTEIEWKMVMPSTSSGRARSRASRSPTGTIYWRQSGNKNYLCVKYAEDAWLCINQRRSLIDALRQWAKYAKRPPRDEYWPGYSGDRGMVTTLSEGNEKVVLRTAKINFGGK